MKDNDFNQINLFEFGINADGNYVNLVEEEKRNNDIAEEEFKEWVKNHNDPLIKIAFDQFVSATDIEFGNHKDLQKRLQDIADSKCYHYGNMEKDLYVFSLCLGKRYILIFENNKHYVVNEPNGWKIDENHQMIELPLDDYLCGKETLAFPALYCHVFDLKGNRIEEYADGENYKKDIRHIVCIQEWKMDQFSKNRMQEGKKIKDFYECEFTLSNLISYYGEQKLNKSNNHDIM